MNHYIKTEVNKLVQRYKTRDVYELIDKLDIILLKVPLDPSVNGMYQYFKRNKIIYLNTYSPYYLKLNKYYYFNYKSEKDIINSIYNY